MKILLTGGNGMVGRNILEHPSASNYEILYPNSNELNLLNEDNIQIYLKKEKPEMIIHGAGIVGGIQANIKYPVKFLVENMMMGFNIIMCAKKMNIEKFMNLGTSCMYPKDALNPLSEEMISKGEMEPTNEGYAISKVAVTRLCEYINRENPTYAYKTVVPCNLYGKYDKFETNISHMIPAAIKKINEAKQLNKDFVEIWGDGLSRREFMYACDFADFVFYSLKKFKIMPQNINVGIGQDYSINEYYKTIAEVISYRGEFTHDLSKPVGMKQKLIDNTKSKKFGWKHKTSLDEGIQKTYDYFLNGVCK